MPEFFSYLKNFCVDGMLDNVYSEYFGFTSKEVENLLNENLVVNHIKE